MLAIILGLILAARKDRQVGIRKLSSNVVSSCRTLGNAGRKVLHKHSKMAQNNRHFVIAGDFVEQKSGRAQLGDSSVNQDISRGH